MVCRAAEVEVQVYMLVLAEVSNQILKVEAIAFPLWFPKTLPIEMGDIDIVLMAREAHGAEQILGQLQHMHLTTRLAPAGCACDNQRTLANGQKQIWHGNVT